jgi:hypothetical protein
MEGGGDNIQQGGAPGAPVISTAQGAARQQQQQRIAAVGAEQMAVYWSRLGVLRAAYLPRLRQTFELAKKRTFDATAAKRAEQVLAWMSNMLLPMLQQTETVPFGGARFTPEELNILEDQIKRLMSMTSGTAARTAAAAAAGAGPAVVMQGVTGGMQAVPTASITEPSTHVQEGGGIKRERSAEAGVEADAAATTGAPKKVKLEPDPAGAEVEQENAVDIEASRAPIIRGPSAFAHLLSCALDTASQQAQPTPPTLHSLRALTLQTPPTPPPHASSELCQQKHRDRALVQTQDQDQDVNEGRKAATAPALSVFLATSGSGVSAPALAMVFQSYDPGYFLPRSEMTRRIFEEDVSTAAAATGAESTTGPLWQLWDEIVSGA